MDTWSIILIVVSVLFFGIVLLTKSNKSTYHPKIRGPRGRLPGRDPDVPKKPGAQASKPPPEA